MSVKPSINVNGVDIDWDLNKGTFTFFNTPSALFWINPSLLTMLQPLAEEVGFNLFRLQVASSASQGTEEDYHNMVTVLGSTFEEGFLKWGSAVSSAGWGTFEILQFNPEKQKSRVRVSNTWELLMQKDLPERWGCPFIQGKIIGIFSHAFKTNCWADEVVISYDAENPFVEFEIYKSTKTISKEIKKERLVRMQEKERLLAKEVENKTIELNDAKIKAEAASYAKSKFLTSMSHELRTPINAVIGLGQVLSADSETLLTEQQKEFIEHILEAGNNMLSLVDQVLTFSEKGIEDKQVNTQEFDPQKVVREVVNVIAPMAERRSISVINLTQGHKLPTTIANEAYFKEVLLIFLTNAVKYISEQGVVEVSSSNIGGGLQRFQVADNGPGIPDCDHPKLFEPFERLKHETGSISGAGVGLSIAKMMVEQMGGAIGYKNNKDNGALFWVDLPLKI